MNTVIWLIEVNGRCLGAGSKEFPYEWVGFTDETAFQFCRERDAQAILDRLPTWFRCSDIAKPVEHVWISDNTPEGRA